MSRHLALWPPPWERNSGLRRAMAYPWLLVAVPVAALAIVLVVPVASLSKLTGRGKAKRTRENVCRTIEQFVDGGGGRWDWDDLNSMPDADPLLEEIRRRCVSVAQRFPPADRRHWCGPSGLDELRRIAMELRADG
jgi:hypothetical protein